MLGATTARENGTPAGARELEGLDGAGVADATVDDFVQAADRLIVGLEMYQLMTKMVRWQAEVNDIEPENILAYCDAVDKMTTGYIRIIRELQEKKRAA